LWGDGWVLGEWGNMEDRPVGVGHSARRDAGGGRKRGTPFTTCEGTRE